MLKQKILPPQLKFTLPKYRYIVGGVAVLCVIFMLSWIFWPRTIAYSYAGQSCTFDPQVLPGSMKQSDSSKVELSRSSGIQVGSVQLLSLQTCATAADVPTAGEVKTATHLFGLPLIANNYSIEIPEAPSVAAPDDTKVAITKSLQASLDSSDTTFSYQLAIDDMTAECSVQDQKIDCPLKPLKLQQGKPYKYQIVRTFDDKEVSSVVAKNLEALPAVAITEGSVKPDQTVYAKPQSLTFSTNKPLASADASLKRTGEQGADIPVKTKVADASLEITLDQELPREVTYELTIHHATSPDSADLNEPYRLNFATSGGPKVANVSVGASNVQPNQPITVTFDQPLKAGQDIGKFVTVEGVPASVSYAGTTATIKLSNAARCSAFKISIKKGLIGAENDLTAPQDWAHSSNISCSDSRVIGYSREGRPITAYYYGTGSSTVLFTGGIHGEEHSGKYTMNSWTSYLEANAHKLPAGRQVVVVPAVNPDGLARGTRLNAAGVNLDRNYPSSDWAKSIQTSGRHLPEGGGSAPASEPETKAIVGLVNSLKIRLAVSHHAQGSLVGSNSVADADRLALSYGSAVGYGSMIGNAEETMGYAITGELEVWLGERGIPAILIELPNRRSNFFDSHRDILWRMATA